MNATVLNEHDANQGAQSQGEFMGMAGNSAWYLLGAAGVAVLMVILLWGVLGVPLLACVSCGAVLCLLAVAYVFTLKNNRPAHYDTDFFEAALVESGLVERHFGPRPKPPLHPFTALTEARPPKPAPITVREAAPTAQGRPSAQPVLPVACAAELPPPPSPDEMVPVATVHELQTELDLREEQLEEALSEQEET